MTLSGMVFAAGFGTRMGALTRTTPKPMLNVGGKPLLAHALDHMAGLSPLVVNTHYLPGQIAAYCQTHAPHAQVIHEDTILETGGGLKNALPALGAGPVVTLNSDTVFKGPEPLALLQDAWHPGMGALLLLIPRLSAQMHTGKGDFNMDAQGRLTRRGDAPNARYVYSGMQILDPSGLARIPDVAFSLNLYWDHLLAKGAVYGLEYPGTWIDVGHPEGLKSANALWDQPDV